MQNPWSEVGRQQPLRREAIVIWCCNAAGNFDEGISRAVEKPIFRDALEVLDATLRAYGVDPLHPDTLSGEWPPPPVLLKSTDKTRTALEGLINDPRIPKDKRNAYSDIHGIMLEIESRTPEQITKDIEQLIKRFQEEGTAQSKNDAEEMERWLQNIENNPELWDWQKAERKAFLLSDTVYELWLREYLVESNQASEPPA